jgi:hypothetical protein
MLESNRKGYAVMNKGLNAYSFEDESLSICKKYCREGYVIVERIPYKYGFSIRVVFRKFYSIINFKYSEKNILWVHWSIRTEYSHKIGKIVHED